MRKITVICGPTAVGKTEYTIKIANALNGEIVNADSMQIYKLMDIGSAKPTEEEQRACKHHLVDCIDPKDSFSVSEYQRMAKAAIEDIFARGKYPIISGGTGLYVNSIIYDMDFSISPETSDIATNEFRNKMQALAEEKGKEFVHGILAEKDPEAAKRIHFNNLKKVIRALEVIELTGEKTREFTESFVPAKEYECTVIALERDREELYDRINRRVDILIEKGLVAEVQGLLEAGLSESDISMKGIGYKEIIAHLNGEYDLDEAIRLVKQNTRHLAKRQMTWFRRHKETKWFNISQYSNDNECIEAIIQWLKTE